MPADLLTRGFAATDAELFDGGVAQPPQYRVFLRNPQYQIVDELDAWISLEFVLRLNGIGTWSLQIANDVRTPSAVELQKAWGVVIKRDGVTVFSGSVTQFSKTFRTITVSGEDDNAFLRALALPDPLTSPPYPDAYDVITAQASAVMVNLVNNNIGPAARADRKVSALALPVDPAIGSVITARAGFQPLISLLSELAVTPLATGLIFGILQSDITPNTLVFTVRAAVDNSEAAKFGVELGTAQDFEDTQQAPAANAPFVLLGDGLAGTRTILEDVDAFSIAEWGRRWETIIDRRDVTDTGEGEQALAEAMAATSSSRKVTVTPIDVPSLQWGREWNLGELVTFAAGGETFQDLIREIHFEWQADRGPVVTPMIGQTGATSDDPLDVMVGTIQNRMTNVERNWRVPDTSITLAMMTANSVGVAQIDDIDAPSNHEVLGYDAATGRFVWLTGNEIVGGGTFVNLTVTGNTVLGDNAATDTTVLNSILTANGASTFNAAVDFNDSVNVDGAATLKNTVTIEDSLLTVLASFDVANQRAIIGSATPLTSASNDKFTVVGGTSYFAGASGPAMGWRYNAAQTGGWTAGVVASGSTPDFAFYCTNGVEVARLGDNTAVLQVNVTGNLGASRGVFGATVFTGTEKLRVNGASLFDNVITISSGGLIISANGASIYGGVTVNTGGVDVTGNSTFRNDLTGTTGTFDWQNSGNSRIKANSTGLGLFGATPIARPTVVGSRSGGAALTNLLTALANLGAITDSTTA